MICISDPLREEAKEVLSALRALGITSTVMLTGDSYRTAAAIAAQVGVDDFRAGVLPADKAESVSYTHLLLTLGLVKPNCAPTSIARTKVLFCERI